jgi:hypothetical protein
VCDHWEKLLLESPPKLLYTILVPYRVVSAKAVQDKVSAVSMKDGVAVNANADGFLSAILLRHRPVVVMKGYAFFTAPRAIHLQLPCTSLHAGASPVR